MNIAIFQSSSVIGSGSGTASNDVFQSYGALVSRLEFQGLEGTLYSI